MIMCSSGFRTNGQLISHGPACRISMVDVSELGGVIDAETELIFLQFTIWSGVQWEGGDCLKESIMERKGTRLKQIRDLGIVPTRSKRAYYARWNAEFLLLQI